MDSISHWIGIPENKEFSDKTASRLCRKYPWSGLLWQYAAEFDTQGCDPVRLPSRSAHWKASNPKVVESYQKMILARRHSGHRMTDSELIDHCLSEDFSIRMSDIQKPDYQQVQPSSDLAVDMPVTETMAEILAAQGLKQQATIIYEQLILKYPEKSAYFTAQIEKL